MLFGQGYALQTVLLWIIYFCSLLNLFLFAYWMPTVLNLIGMTPGQAVFASSLRDFGGIFVVLYLGLAIDRIGPERTLALHYAAGAVFIAMIALVALPYAMLCVVTFLAGMTIIGSQTGANGACGKLYPARMRTSGLGWALGIGRLGGIAAPVLGGYLLAARPAADAHLPGRLPVCADRGGGHGAAGVSRQSCASARRGGGRVARVARLPEVGRSAMVLGAPAQRRLRPLRHPVAEHLIFGVADLIEVDQRLLAVSFEAGTDQRACAGEPLGDHTDRPRPAGWGCRPAIARFRPAHGGRCPSSHELASTRENSGASAGTR